MTTVFNNMNEDIKAFRVLKLVGNRLVEAPEITDIHCYTHGLIDLHHFIKAQDYKRNMEWYKSNGIEEVLIAMPRIVHTHLEDGIYGLSDELFFRKYKIKKEKLLFNKRKWLEQQVKGELKC